MKAKNLPKQPLSAKVVSAERMRDRIKSRYVPRDPKDGEVMLLLDRPQASPRVYGGADAGFTEYAAGDFLRGQPAFTPDPTSPFYSPASQPRPAVPDRVIVLAKPAFTRAGEGWKKWEQLVVVREATDEDRAAIAGQQASQAAESKRVMDAMMSS